MTNSLAIVEFHLFLVVSHCCNDLYRMNFDAVQSLCQTACTSRSSVPEWLLALPLLHFLRDDSAPFQPPTVTQVNHRQWWGLGNLYNDVKIFREKQSNVE